MRLHSLLEWMGKMEWPPGAGGATRGQHLDRCDAARSSFLRILHLASPTNEEGDSEAAKPLCPMRLLPPPFELEKSSCYFLMRPSIFQSERLGTQNWIANGSSRAEAG